MSPSAHDHFTYRGFLHRTLPSGLMTWIGTSAISGNDTRPPSTLFRIYEVLLSLSTNIRPIDLWQQVFKSAECCAAWQIVTVNELRLLGRAGLITMTFRSSFNCILHEGVPLCWIGTWGSGGIQSGAFHSYYAFCCLRIGTEALLRMEYAQCGKSS